MSVLSRFHPSIQAWFAARFTGPTAVQTETWPRVAAGEHVLATAPTGSGKTLTAFLWALDRFATGEWLPGATRVLYVSPLKALNNDIARNLTGPLAELERDHGFPPLTVRTRSGDTSQAERGRMLRSPPDILITTPESLALLLSGARGRQALATVETVILDEVHAVVGNRRGVQLMVAVERLAWLAGEFQRIALSATVTPLDAVAQWVAGVHPDGGARPISIVDAAADKRIELEVRLIEGGMEAIQEGEKIWSALAPGFRERIAANRSTLFFTNSRRLAERVTLEINNGREPLAYAHHGSLSREIRTEVERRLKAGELRAIVATSSLELGIDIGELDEVVMIQSPPSVAAALQRIGRAGHAVGATSRGTLWPSHPLDVLQAAVLAEGVAARDIEPVQPLAGALDVLAQIVVATCATETWTADDLYRLVRSSGPYRKLPREQFDLVIDMLAGRYAGSRVRELEARVRYDRINGALRSTRGAILAFYSSGGTIPDRGYFQLRHADSGTPIGELDEEYVWEATTGQTFMLGTQSWRIHRITHNDVFVRPARSAATAPPFWKNETLNRSQHFSDRMVRWLEDAEEGLARGERQTLRERLARDSGFDDAAADTLVELLERQRSVTGAPLPHRHHVLAEFVHGGPAGEAGPGKPRQLVLHTLWGGRLNRPWAIALGAAWRRVFSSVPEIHADDNAIAIQIPAGLDPAMIITLVQPGDLEGLLREGLENSGFFGARFRECAARALLLPKARFNQRMPLWMSRMQAKKLMTAVRAYSDFPVLLETWRTCLADEFEPKLLAERLVELNDGTIAWTLVETATPSPFAAGLAFAQVSRHMYADDEPETRAGTALSKDLIRSAVFDEHLRPRIDPEVIEEFEAKRRRLAPGYEPQDADDWNEWVKERVLLPAAEFPAGGETHLFRVASAGGTWLAHRELAGILRSTGLLAGCALSHTGEGELPHVDDARDAEQLAFEALSFYGPRTRDEFALLLPVVPPELFDDAERYVQGPMVAGSDAVYVCDAANFEILLRFQRAARRAGLPTRPLADLPGFLAHWQGFGVPWSDDRALVAIERLAGHGAPVKVWLDDVLPARFGTFPDSALDALMARSGLQWLGTGPNAITLCYPEDVALLRREAAPTPVATHFRDPHARYSWHQLADAAKDPDFEASLWAAVWQGAVSTDALHTLRAGLAGGFELPAFDGSRRAVRGRAAGWPGNWLLNPSPEPDPDPLTALDDARERARRLVDRYGVVCREFVNREGAGREIYRALRVMELGGEVVAGLFFEGLSGPQFASPRAIAALRRFTRPRAHWLNATDSAAPCGLGIELPGLPHRRPGNYLAFVDGRLALTVENGGRRLEFHLDPDDDAIDHATAVLVHLARTERRFAVETINGEPARSSPWLVALDRVLVRTADHRNLWFEAR